MAEDVKDYCSGSFRESIRSLFTSTRLADEERVDDNRVDR
jgi:hypothetical protein